MSSNRSWDFTSNFWTKWQAAAEGNRQPFFRRDLKPAALPAVS